MTGTNAMHAEQSNHTSAASTSGRGRQAAEDEQHPVTDAGVHATASNLTDAMHAE